jgi:hypothetical protein
MKKMQLAVLFLLIIFTASAQVPAFQWARNGGNRGSSVVTDDLGNVYIGGYFSGTKDFDPGPGTYFLNAVGIADDAFMSKFDAAGNFMWAIQFGGTATSYVEELAIDDAGNVYATGRFSLDIDLDPGPGTLNVTGAGGGDIYVVKVNPGGNLVWGKVMAGTNSEIAHAITIDPMGNVIVTGGFMGTVDFDPGPGVANIASGGTSDNCFVAKLNSNGDYVFATKFNAGNFSQGHSLATDPSGNIYVSGTFTLTANFGGTNLTAAGGGDIFVAKLTPFGALLWVDNLVSSTSSESDECMRLDKDGNVYITGRFIGTADFDPGPAVFNMTPTGSDDVFISKLNSSGNLIWALHFGGSNAEAGNGIALDTLGNVYTTGLFQATADFDPGPGVFNLTATSNDIFISKIDPTGAFQWAVSFLGSTLDAGTSITTDTLGNIYTTGFFDGPMDFDHTAGVYTIVGSVTQAFIHKMGPGNGGTLPLTLLDFTGTATGKENILKWTTTREINTKLFEIEWSINGQKFDKMASQPAAGNSTRNEQYSFRHRQPVNGNNYYRLKMIDIDGRFTYSAVVKINNTITSPVVSLLSNPVSALLEMNVQAVTNETIGFNIHGADGKMVAVKYVTLVKGSNRISWELHQLAAGAYFISSPGRFETIPFVKR